MERDIVFRVPYINIISIYKKDYKTDFQDSKRYENNLYYY